VYQKILVPTDGSPTSSRGLDEAIALGKLTGGRLRLVHVVDELSFAFGASAGLTYSGDFLDVLREAGTKVLEAATERVRAAGLEVDAVLNDSLAGRVCDLVLAQAKVWGADLIVIGTHGRRGIGRLFLGSDAEMILRSATVPVLLVRAGEAAPAATP
jgi:nucleotide-binding universal stress UspA family protein